MAPRHTLPQISKYDIAQKVVSELADPASRAILFSIVRRGNTASELSHRLRIPLSTAYKKISDLEDLGLVDVEKWLISDKGRKYKVYRSRIRRAEIVIKKPEPALRLVPL